MNLVGKVHCNSCRNFSSGKSFNYLPQLLLKIMSNFNKKRIYRKLTKPAEECDLL